jgi:hypothetical protein
MGEGPISTHVNHVAALGRDAIRAIGANGHLGAPQSPEATRHSIEVNINSFQSGSPLVARTGFMTISFSRPPWQLFDELIEAKARLFALRMLAWDDAPQRTEALPLSPYRQRVVFRLKRIRVNTAVVWVSAYGRGPQAQFGHFSGMGRVACGALPWAALRYNRMEGHRAGRLANEVKKCVGDAGSVDLEFDAMAAGVMAAGGEVADDLGFGQDD